MSLNNCLVQIISTTLFISGCSTELSNRNEITSIDPTFASVADDLLVLKHDKCGSYLGDEKFISTIKSDKLFPFFLSLKRIDLMADTNLYEQAFLYANHNLDCKQPEMICRGILNNLKFKSDKISFNQSSSVTNELKIKTLTSSSSYNFSFIPAKPNYIIYYH